MSTCRANNCNIRLLKRSHVYCRQHYHLSQLDGLKSPRNRFKRHVEDKLKKKCRTVGCSEYVFRNNHTYCRFHYHQTMLENI